MCQNVIGIMLIAELPAKIKSKSCIFRQICKISPIAMGLSVSVCVFVCVCVRLCLLKSFG